MKKGTVNKNIKRDVDPNQLWDIVGELGDGAFGKVYKVSRYQFMKWVGKGKIFDGTLVICRTVCPINSFGRAPDLQAGGCSFDSCIMHIFCCCAQFY